MFFLLSSPMYQLQYLFKLSVEVYVLSIITAITNNKVEVHTL